MRTDINKIDDITPEMELNDRLYEELQDEFDNFLIDFYCNDYDYEDDDEISYDFEDLYFMRRVLSTLRNHDLPLKAAIGLFFFREKFEIINSIRKECLPDEDSDTEMFEFILELGYRCYDLIYLPEKTEEEMYELVKGYREFREELMKRYD